jgi:hypothetical protein
MFLLEPSLDEAVFGPQSLAMLQTTTFAGRGQSHVPSFHRNVSASYLMARLEKTIVIIKSNTHGYKLAGDDVCLLYHS